MHTQRPLYFFFFFVLINSLGITSQKLFAQSGKPDIRFHQLPIQDLSNPNVKDIHQDKTGFLWFSTNDGLNKYDGKRISIYNPFLKDSLNRAFFNIYDLHEDENGLFWIATWKGLSRFEPATGKFKNFGSSERFQNYRDLEEVYQEKGPLLLKESFLDSQGRIWLGTQLHGLHLFDPETEQFIKQYPYLPRNKDDGYSLGHERPIIIWEDKNGMIWVLTRGFILNRLNPNTDKIDRINHAPFLDLMTEKHEIQLVKVDQFEKIWIGDQEHLYYWDPMNGTYETYTYPKGFSPLKELEVSAIHKDQSGIIWITSPKTGLKRWDTENERIDTYRHNTADNGSLITDNLGRIYEDRSGLIWIATPTKGAIYFDPTPGWYKHYFKKSDAPNQLSGNNIVGISKNKEGKLWVAASDALGRLDLLDPQNGTVEHYTLRNDTDGALIKSIYESPKESNVIWVGYMNSGLDRWDLNNNTIQNFRYDTNDSTGLSSIQVLSIYEDRNELLWFTSQWGMTSLDRSTMTFKKYLNIDQDSTSLSYNEVWNILEDRDGRFWIGTENGLNKLDRSTGKFTRYFHDPSNPHSISNNIILSIFEDSRGMLWIGCPNGLNLMDREKGTFTNFSNLLYAPGDQHWKKRDAILKIYEDDFGRLWLSTRRGISVLSNISEEGFTIKHIDMLGKSFLGGIGINPKYKNENGDLYFGSKEGLFVIYPDQWKEDTIAAPLVFTNFKINNAPVQVRADRSSSLSKPIHTSPHLELTHRDKIITFEFAMLDYSRPDLFQYAYQLDGLNDDWVNISNQNEITFTNLDPGNYTLHVKAANENGHWNAQQAKISFYIKPAWWQTNWFRIGGFVGLITLLVIGFSLRNQSIKMQNLRLQNEVNNRTKDLNEALSDLKTTQSELVQSEKMALLGTLIAGVAHEVNNPLGAVTASNSNIRESTKFLKNNFPKIFQVLDQKHQALFLQFIEAIPGVHAHITGKERRQLKRNLIKQLDKADIPNSDQVADTLIEVDVTSDLEQYFDLFKHTEQTLLLESVYHSAQLQMNSSNIKTAANRASKIVYALRSYSHNYEPDTRVSVNVAETVDNVLVLFYNTLKKGIEVQKNYESVSLISANPDELQQVWTNIIQNALQAMEYKGKLIIDITEEDQQVVVSITDNGPGIDPAIKEKIFEPLSTTKAPGEGSGLGLHICKRIIEDHNGKITFNSEPGKTTFEVWLPTE